MLCYFLPEPEEKQDTTDAPAVTSLPVSSAVPTASSGLDVHTISSTKTLNYRSGQTLSHEMHVVATFESGDDILKVSTYEGTSSED